MVYYKVVRRSDRGRFLTSCLLNPENPFYRVYRENGVTKTVSNGMAFTTLEAAQKFSVWEPGASETEVWSCTGRRIPLPKRAFRCTVHFISDLKQIMAFMLYGKKVTGDSRYYVLDATGAFPQGAVRLRNLKLKEKMSRE
jgi:hypothetical protein